MDGRLATVMVDFPPANALTLKAREEMIEVFDQLLGMEKSGRLSCCSTFYSVSVTQGNKPSDDYPPDDLDQNTCHSNDTSFSPP